MENLHYSPKVIHYFAHPKNMGVIKDADSVATVGNKICGDVMKLYIKIGQRKKKGKSEQYIKDIKFQTLGCAAAIATSSILTEMAKGKSLDEAAKITDQKITKELGGLPKIKFHCSVLAGQALQKAIKDFQKKKK